ncbi:MAG: NUDIX hydrolase [Candidatus Thermoplasmatota archaeon]|nr:NUDIX hydrolase [Candidatus Thermoplasmatota archaeon]
MAFEIRVVRNNPLGAEEDMEAALKTFLKQIGYLPEGSEDDVGFRLMNDCFLMHPEKPWTVDELLTHLNANRSTLYRYLNKLKGMDILDEVIVPYEGAKKGPSRKTRKCYRIRYTSLSNAWTLVESHVQVAMSNYRRTVDHIDRLIRNRSELSILPKIKVPRIAVDGMITRDKDGKREILLVKRGAEPYKDMWAFPGGFMEYNESSEETIIREVLEETGVVCTSPILKQVRSMPGRDPRGHVISIVFDLKVENDIEPQAGDDASEARWFDVLSLPPLAFDHESIIKEGSNHG